MYTTYENQVNLRLCMMELYLDFFVVTESCSLKVSDEPHTMHHHQKNIIRSKCGILLHGGDNVRCKR